MERDFQTPGRTSDDDGTYPVPAGAAPLSAEYITSFLLHIRRRAADMAVDPAPGAATPADTAVDTSRGRERNNASISGPSDGDIPVAVDDARASGASNAGTGVAVGMPAGATDDAPGIAPDGVDHSTVAVHRGKAGNPRQRNRKRSRPHSARDHSRMVVQIFAAHEESSASMLESGLSGGDGAGP